MDVLRFLVTGTQDQTDFYHRLVMHLMNAIDVRANQTTGYLTVFYTCMADDRAFVLDRAAGAGVTVQELHVDESGERYELVQGDGPKWEVNDG